MRSYAAEARMGIDRGRRRTTRQDETRRAGLMQDGCVLSCRPDEEGQEGITRGKLEVIEVFLLVTE